MGKKSRRVRDTLSLAANGKTHIVLWKAGNAIKKTLSVDLARGGTFKDMKITLKSAPRAGLLRRPRGEAGGKEELCCWCIWVDGELEVPPTGHGLQAGNTLRTCEPSREIYFPRRHRKT